MDTTEREIATLRAAAFMHRKDAALMRLDQVDHQRSARNAAEIAEKAELKALDLENVIVRLGGEVLSYGLGEHDSPLTEIPT